jgi:hypothetical protein
MSERQEKRKEEIKKRNDRILTEDKKMRLRDGKKK